jgi:hypothetical protein
LKLDLHFSYKKYIYTLIHIAKLNETIFVTLLIECLHNINQIFEGLVKICCSSEKKKIGFYTSQFNGWKYREKKNTMALNQRESLDP